MDNIMDLNKLLNENKITIDLLVGTYGFEAFSGGEITTIDSAPNKVAFGDSLFIAMFIFDQKKIERIELTPLIEGVQVPNYPSEKYQEIKRKHCRNILNGIYGAPDHIDDTGEDWIKDGFTVSCYSIMKGRRKYCGGDIVINMR